MGGEAGGQTCGQDNGIFHAVGLQGLPAGLSGLTFVNEPRCSQRLGGGVHAAEGEAGCLRDFALGATGMQDDLPQHQEFILAYSQRSLDSSFYSIVALYVTIKKKCSKSF